VALRNLDLAVLNKLINGKEFGEIFVPKAAESLAVKLSKPLRLYSRIR
jgi:hypothetical protein